MVYKTIHLSEIYPFLGTDGKDPILKAYMADNLAEMHWQERKHPCILVCPGGGYEFCSQREQEPIALSFLPAGFHVFVLDYSVSPHQFPTQLREVAAAIELIYSYSREWHCDTDHIILMGFSAGGHLAAHYANTYDSAEVRTVFPESKPVFATILGYPVITAEKKYAVNTTACLLGERNSSEEMRNRVSCEKLVTSRTPPAFIWHTASDRCVPVQHSLLYAMALAENGIAYSLHIYHAGEHGLATADRQTNEILPEAVTHVSEWVREAVEFLRDLFDW